MRLSEEQRRSALLASQLEDAARQVGLPEGGVAEEVLGHAGLSPNCAESQMTQMRELLVNAAQQHAERAQVRQ